MADWRGRTAMVLAIGVILILLIITLGILIQHESVSGSGGKLLVAVLGTIVGGLAAFIAKGPKE